MQKHYVIGDVHGEYQTLLALVEKLPHDAKLFFVGDLIDRGSQSKEVVEFVRKNNHLCVMGNHEALCVEYGKQLIQHLMDELLYSEMHPRWDSDGRLNTFCSYGLLSLRDGVLSEFIKDEKAIDQLLDDIRWMQKLPIYLELDAVHLSDKRVVISHSNISKVWKLHHNDEEKNHFFETVLWNRERETSDEADIFNIYGHTPQKYNVEINDDFVNIDTGCCFYSIKDNMYGRLSAYCVESGEVVKQERVAKFNKG